MWCFSISILEIPGAGALSLERREGCSNRSQSWPGEGIPTPRFNPEEQCWADRICEPPAKSSLPRAFQRAEVALGMAVAFWASYFLTVGGSEEHFVHKTSW